MRTTIAFLLAAAPLSAPLFSPLPALATEPPPVDREVLSRPLVALDDAARETFFRGRGLFRTSWVIAGTAPAERDSVAGLGPLYNRLACVSCHPKNGRGRAPDGSRERMQSMLVRLSVPGRDGHGGPRPHPAYGDQLNEEGVPGVPGEGRAQVTWITSRVRLADGSTVELRRPRIRFAELAHGPAKGMLYSARVSPPVAGLGLLDAVPAASLQALAAEKKPDGVRGRVNTVWDAVGQGQAVGRFGLKSNVATLRQQIAGAFLGDMGITSPLFPTENCTPAQTACRQAPSAGQPELSQKQLDDIVFYVAHLAPPPRRPASADFPVERGAGLFRSIGCALCHRERLETAAHPEYPLLAAQAIAPYSDLLLHDMGAALADGRPDFAATGREWRTPPLWGLGSMAAISEATHLLHDGRARNVEEAILWHGGEAAKARQRYTRLPARDREALKAFLESL